MNDVVEKSNVVQPRREPFKYLIIALSVIIPLAVAVLFRVEIDGYDFSFLPPVYATINGLTAIFLIVAVRAIKNGKRVLHERLIKLCMLLSSSFLIMYILYHMTSESTTFEGVGMVRYIYYFILITHIILSIGVIPMVLFTYVRAWSGNFERHRALAKFTFPLWLYVAITGVIVYLMISPYYS